MAVKLEVQSRNGTLSINQQTTSQRTKFGQRFRGSLGVASDNLLGASGIFSESPIGEYGSGTSDDINGGVRNRNNAGNNDLNVYETFAGFVDGAVDLSGGFGFSATELGQISLDYKHAQNPLIDDADALTTGEAHGDDGHKKRFLGFPDLVPPDIHNVNTAPQESASTTLNKDATDNFGSTTSDYRGQASITDSRLGYFAEDGELNQTASNDANTLGQYFKNTGSQGS